MKHKDIKIEIEKYLESNDMTCKICGSYKNLQFHHIVPRSKCNKDIRMNDYRNLVLLCSECHYKVHHNICDYPEYYKRKFEWR